MQLYLLVYHDIVTVPAADGTSRTTKQKRPNCPLQGSPAVFSKIRGFLPHSQEWFSFFLLYQVIKLMTFLTVKNSPNTKTSTRT